MLFRTASHYRPYAIHDGHAAEIILYADGNLLLRVAGWLEHEHRDVIELDVTAPKRAIKADLNRKDNFFIRHKDWYTKEKKYDVYLYCPKLDIGPQFADEHSDKQSISYSCKMTIPFKGRTSDGPIDEIVTTIWLRRGRTAFGLKIDKIQETLKNQGVILSSSDIELCLKVYNMTMKKEISGGEEKSV